MYFGDLDLKKRLEKLKAMKLKKGQSILKITYRNMGKTETSHLYGVFLYHEDRDKEYLLKVLPGDGPVDEIRVLSIIDIDVLDGKSITAILNLAHTFASQIISLGLKESAHVEP